MNFPDHVLFNVNVAVVAMILKPKSKSDEMWDMSEKLQEILIECLRTDDSVLDFINWFFDGIKKTFEVNNLASQNTSSFTLQYQQPVLLFPDTCFQCKKPYTSITPQDKWCNSCESYLFESKFHTWTSGNVELDRFIRQTQREATDSTSFLRWIPFSSFTDLNKIGEGGFSEVYSGKYTKDRLDGTLKQWVTNMEHQIILDHLRCYSEDDKNLEEVSVEIWESTLIDFAAKMRNIYQNRKTLKCKPREIKINRLTKLKSLLKKRPSIKKNKRKLSDISNESATKITQVPVTVSPIRNKLTPKKVALKRLVDSQNLSSSFIREMKNQYISLKKSSKVPMMYGLTQDPQTKDYFIVLQYANDFDLHKYLVQNCASIDWWQRISILDGIVKGIYEVHKENLIHHNLHTGNILVRRSKRRKEVKIWISDSGLWGPADNNPNLLSGAASSGNSNRNSIPSVSPSHLTRKGIYGILPYVAPEVLQGKEYTKSSDIYSLGIIMWELSNSATLKKQQRHKQPFHDQPYDINLATEIVVNEKRPDIDEANIPECWLDLMNKCWASKPEDRPGIEDIMKITGEWNMERRKSLNLGSKSSLVFSLNQSISSNMTNENVVGQFLEAEKRRVERLNKGKQAERDNKPKSVEDKKDDENIEDKPNIIGTVNQDDDVHPEASMISRLIDFTVETPSSNNNEILEIIYENPNSPKEKVDSGYQQPREDQDSESLEQKEKIDQIEDETEPKKTIEEEKDSNKHVEEKQHVVNEIIEPILVQEDKTKHLKIDDNQIGVKQDNQDNPIKNGIEANSETGSKGK